MTDEKVGCRGCRSVVTGTRTCIYLQVSSASSYLYLSFLTHSNQLLCVIDFLGNKHGKRAAAFLVY